MSDDGAYPEPGTPEYNQRLMDVARGHGTAKETVPLLAGMIDGMLKMNLLPMMDDVEYVEFVPHDDKPQCRVILKNRQVIEVEVRVG